jgi:CHAT domain-containing protein
MRPRRIHLLIAALTLALAGCQPTPLSVEEAKKIETDIGKVAPTFIPPPRTTADILSLLHEIKPDPAYGADLRRRATAAPMPDLVSIGLAVFLHDRGEARRDLGDIARAGSDLREAVRLLDASGANPPTLRSYLVDLRRTETELGNYRDALAAARRSLDLSPSNEAAARSYALTLFFDGDLDKGESATRLAAALAAGYVASPRSNPVERLNAQGGIDYLHARVNSLHGRYADAEPQIRQGIVEFRAALADFAQAPRGYQSREFYEQVLDTARLLLTQILVSERRYAEAEAEGRQMLVDSVRGQGAGGALAAQDVLNLADIISQAGRHREAARLAQAALGIYAGRGLRPADGAVAAARAALGSFQVRSGDMDAAVATYASLAADLKGDPDAYEQILGTNSDFSVAEIHAGHIDHAIAIETRCIEKLMPHLGADNFQTSVCRGYLGWALAAAGRREDALAAFRAALPALLAGSDDDPASENIRVIRVIILQYLRLLDETRTAAASPGGGAAAAEGFAAADALRNLTARQTLAEATARMSLPDPALADLARREQDIGNERREYARLLLDIASAPPDQQDESAVATLRGDTANLDKARTALRQEIAQRFPRYLELLSPHAATVEEARSLLRPDEALLLITSLEDRTLVWSVTKDAPLAYASVPLRAADLAFSVALLRHSLDPRAARLGDISPFDVAVAHKLYAALLEPVASAWRGRKLLIAVVDGPLAQVPLSVLVTRTVPQPQDREGQALFTGYRDVPFLAREIAVSQAPSVSALLSLRRLAPHSAERRPFIGFGDPWFNAQEAADARRTEPPLVEVASRGEPLLRAAPATSALNSATLGQLPRLPDTAQELREVAATLGADPTRDVYLGDQASEETVETLKLDDRRVVMFATHGLVPGDLDGLTQPALALSPPAVAGGRGDGLLTASKILGLKFDADWVVLSACNTAGGGAEAVSTLGGAFFYAGAHALLVTNWPVETRSARLLTTGTFRHQAADASLTRAEALQRSEIDLINGRGSVNAEGQTVFSYAHPIFWAPFSLVGDGG